MNINLEAKCMNEDKTFELILKELKLIKIGLALIFIAILLLIFIMWYNFNIMGIKLKQIAMRFSF